jgi:hypothetical protein
MSDDTWRQILNIWLSDWFAWGKKKVHYFLARSDVSVVWSVHEIYSVLLDQFLNSCARGNGGNKWNWETSCCVLIFLLSHVVLQYSVYHRKPSVFARTHEFRIVTENWVIEWIFTYLEIFSERNVWTGKQLCGALETVSGGTKIPVG